jgi:flavin prenyltransferase
MKIVVGISGASGSIYGITLLKKLTREHEIHLIITDAARVVINQETECSVKEIEMMADYVYGQHEIAALIASGSFRFDAMVIIPCSIKTLSSIAHCYSENLLARVADVALKEKRKLILCTREMPLHEGHLRVMLAAAKMGALICPLSPAFYSKPVTLEDIYDQVSGKIMDLMNIECSWLKRWSGVADTESVDVK